MNQELSQGSKSMDKSRAPFSRTAVTLMVAALTFFAVLCFAFAGMSILENGIPTAQTHPHSAPSLG
jgi:hypothetical protein